MLDPEQQIAELKRELAEKKRELEIEASLERVRAQAMGMVKPDDLLNICEILFREFKSLGFSELRNSMINIHNDDKKTFMNYDYSDEMGKSITPFNFNTHPVMEKQINQSRMANDAFSEAVYKGKDLEEWKKFRKKFGEKDDPRIDKIEALYYYFYSIGTGTIGISTFSPVGEEKLSLLKRFRNVFNLAYKRYTDISLAEANAKEAQIQLALERVRARTMAMYKSEELSETSFVLFEQLKELGEKAEQISIMIYDEKEKAIELYSTIYGRQWDETGKLPFEESPVHKKIFQAWEQKQKSVVVDLTGQELTDFNKFKMKYSEQYKSENELPGNRWVIHNAFFSKGALTFSTYEPRPPEMITLLERFAGVFDLAYTRFLDLKKAEAQAREAQIEAALERVRAQSMAMHKSDELFNVIRIVSEQLQQLGFHFDNVSFAEANQAHDYKFWLSVANQPRPYYLYVPYIDNPMFERVKEAQQKGLSFYSDVLTPEENRQWHMHVFDHNDLDFVSEERKEYIFSKGFARSIAFLPNIMLIIGNYASRPYSEEENKIINRFAAVFQQSYTRFLDLQKAEAQAREAEIQLALERVRARTMAMHKSDELAETSTVIFEQFQILGILPQRCGFVIQKEDESLEIWGSVKNDKSYKSYKLGIINSDVHPIFTLGLDEWRKGSPAFFYTLTGKALKDYYKAISILTNIPADIARHIIDETEIEYHYNAFFKHGSITTIFHKPPDDEEQSIIRRFAAVLEQTYTRFLDLQNAEEQTREAQIEASLERVRSRTMAMHKSDELAATAKVLFEQFDLLGKIPDRMGIGIFNEENKKIELWLTDQSGNELRNKFSFSIDEPTSMAKIYNAWKDRKDALIVDLTGKTLEVWLQYVTGEGRLPINLNNIKGRRVHHAAFFSHGFLLFTANEPVDDAMVQVLVRFARVFDQTYRRFLDLQKAEAQAREAQIEAALERLRSRTMAMHYSNELAEVIKLLYDQLKVLDLEIDVCIINIFKEDSRDFYLWISASGQVYPDEIFVPFLNNPMFTRVFNAKDKAEKLLTDRLTKEEKDEYFYHVIKHSPAGILMDEERKKDIFKEKSFTRSFSISKLTGLLIANFNDYAYTDKENEILIRFGKVFEQTYTRFLDLKKAEAQAREAKIEASLERIRSKALAMNSSEDFVAAISVFYHELSLMSHTPRRCGVGLIGKETRLVELSTFNTTNKGDSIEVLGKIKMEGHPVLNAVYENWLKKREYHVVLRGNEIKEYYKLIRPQISIPDYSNDRVQYGYFFYFDEGGVYTWTEKELNEDELQIYRRFTKVFSLAHKRYLDIKEAETRAIEAVRQASLNRIRAEIASMRTAEDLNRITPIIWRELKNLEVPFIRCGVFIIDELQEKAHVYLSTPDGKSLGALSLSFDANELIGSTVNHWREKQVYKEHWNKEEFIRWTKSMIEIGQVREAEIYQGLSAPPDSLYLHLVPFRQGMLYVGDVSPLSDEKLDLVKSLAEAFSIAYARYEDFHLVESAFKELDKLSKELKVKNQELENENERKAIEMEEARELQLAMLPKRIPEHPDLDIKVYMQTATEVGGDYYDFSFSKDGSINIAIGDATGHGMKAGTLVTMMKSLFIANSSITGIEEFFNSSNSAIKNSNLKRMMAAFAMLNIKDHKVKFINAGMPPLYHYIKKENEVREIKHFNLPLGAMSPGNYKSIEFDLNTGDVLIMMSDGFPELRCYSDDLFGYERVYSAIQKAAGKEPEDIISHFKNEADCWSENKELEDDITFVVIKVK